MLDVRDRQALPRERALAEGLKEVIAELRLVDVADYVAYLRLEQYGNVRDIVASATELYLKPGVLRFADSGEARLGWGRSPVVRLAMEFLHDDVRIHFDLELGAAVAAVDITYLTDLSGESLESKDHVAAEAITRTLQAAVSDSQLSRQQGLHVG